jgi:predicted secreted protein
MSIKSFGVKVEIDEEEVGGLKEVNPGGGDVTFIETTTHGGDGWKTYIGGLKDGGTLELSGDYDIDDDGQALLRDSLGETETVVVTFSDESTTTFSGIIGPYNVTNPLDETVGFTSSIKITGEVTYAPADAPEPE